MPWVCAGPASDSDSDWGMPPWRTKMLLYHDFDFC